MAAVNDMGDAMDPVRIACREREAILRVFGILGTFRAVIEASGTYRWLHDLLRPYGTILSSRPP
jgi:hypothetical protein